MEGNKEFYISVAVLGGIIFAGLMIAIGLTMIGIGIYKKNKSKPKLIGDEKERQNGQEKKGGARVHW